MDEAPPADSTLVGRLARRLPFFYGWVIVSISFLCVFMMGASSFWAVPVFVGPMHDDTGWSHAGIFAGLTAHFLCGALGGLVFGRLTDRRGGAARLLAIGVLVDAAALISLRWVETPAQFVLLYGVVGGFGSTGIRLVQSTIVAKWFIVQRGRAVGFSTNGGSASALIMVPLIALLISELGWRDAWSALGVIMMVLLLPIVPLAVRAPEDLGLLPDNGVAASPSRPRPAEARSFTLTEVMHSGRFWFLLGGILIGTYSLQAHTVVMLPHFEQIGFSTTTAASSLAVYGLFSIGMRLVWGVMAERRGARLAIILQATLTAVGAVLLLQVTDRVTLYAAMAFQGMVLSGYPTLQILIWPEFFGRLHIGSIVGLTQFFSAVAGAAGPVVAGFLFDTTGSYEAALWMLLATWLSCAAVMYAVRPTAPAKLRGASPA